MFVSLLVVVAMVVVVAKRFRKDPIWDHFF